jgi:UDP-3-O-[3-hydroxymyristoyl] glucosamine N-acyltransferase
MAYSLAHIAHEFSLDYAGDDNLSITGLCGLSDDISDHLSFVSDRKFLPAAETSNIPAFVTLPGSEIKGKAILFHENPEYAMAKIAQLFVNSNLTQAANVHPSAVVDATAEIAPSAVLGANVVVGADTIIGERTILLAGCVIMDRVEIGTDCLIHPNCVVREDCVLSDRVILQPGVVIGGDGFGFVKDGADHVKIPQLGNVVIESDVEVGANSSIDRGRFTATRIGRGTKIDDAVMVAHNVQIGERCLIVAQSGISGSSRLGDEVVLAGQVGLVGHIEIANNVTLLGQSMATKNIREPGVWAGSPARPAKLWRRAVARLYAGLARD